MAMKGGESSIECLVLDSVVCMLRSETHALVTISNVWNSKGNKKCLDKAFYCDSSLGRHVILFYILVSVRQEIPKVLAQRR